MGTEYPKCIYLREGGWKTAHSREEEDKIRKADEPVIEFDPPTNVKIRASDMRPRKRIGPKQLADVIEIKPPIDNGAEACLARYEEKTKLMFSDIQPEPKKTISGNKLISPDMSV
jgi:hypothetical protein